MAVWSGLDHRGGSMAVWSGLDHRGGSMAVWSGLDHRGGSIAVYFNVRSWNTVYICLRECGIHRDCQ